jgi:hypothetical protein
MKDYPAKLPAFERYGSPNVFMQFDPHLTLLANEASPALATYMARTAQQPRARWAGWKDRYRPGRCQWPDRENAGGIPLHVTALITLDQARLICIPAAEWPGSSPGRR